MRLRAIDACGNAGLSDVSILPLAEIEVTALGNCFHKQMRLMADSIPHARYTWYRIKNRSEQLVQDHLVLDIPYLLPADTGTYILEVNVNNGCLVKRATFKVTGNCSASSPVGKIMLQVRQSSASVVLNWVAEDEKQVLEYIVERRSETGSFF